MLQIGKTLVVPELQTFDHLTEETRRQMPFKSLLVMPLTANEHKIMSPSLGEDWWKHPPKYAAPSGRLLSPEHIATAAVYWIGDESRPISGSVLELEQYPVIGRNTVKEED